MLITNDWHLTYCTNVHPGESWADSFENLKKYVPTIKSEVAPNQSFGIGLRLSALATEEIQQDGHLDEFKDWLSQENCYVFTVNGFPYSSFHRQRVKDDVYKPDWTSTQRLNYTLGMFDVLKELLPEGVDGGISTSPIAYKPWFFDQPEQLQSTFTVSTDHIVQVIEHLYHIHQETGKELHLDIEPEPDCVLETTQELVQYFREYLIPQGVTTLGQSLGVSSSEAEEVILRHCQMCFDICHAAVEYESPSESFQLLRDSGVRIGKVQISAAIRGDVLDGSNEIIEEMAQLDESTYLHQTIARKQDGQLLRLRDLDQLNKVNPQDTAELRTHFHVPIFMDEFGSLKSTQPTILETFEELKKHRSTNHLEVETYTWEVLPKALQIELSKSVERELQWVTSHLDPS
ncbi:MAG: metabolite traffic protein EboE [Bacteroidota bacterium]